MRISSLHSIGFAKTGCMPRRARLDAPGVLHHVTARGIERCDIFRDDADRLDLLERIGDATRIDGVCILAWSLMTNHCHLLVRSGEPGVSLAMQRAFAGYASKFNRRHGRCGHLFQNRFGSKVVEEDPYLLELVRYIHLNPVRAGIVADLEALDVYPWTGHAALMGRATVPWQEIAEILSVFGSHVGRARAAYRRYLADSLASGDGAKLQGGGVRRRGGELVAVAQLGRGRERWAFDERVLGSEEFMLAARDRAFEHRCVSRPRRNSGEDVAMILQTVSDSFGLTIAELCSGTKRRDVVEARALAGFLAVRGAGLRTAEVAAELGVTPRALSRILARGARIATHHRISIRDL